MINKPLDSITIDDIQDLIEDNIIEKKTLDYKLIIGDKKEFAIDVSSFANASGGNIIIGVAEEKLDKKKTGKYFLSPIKDIIPDQMIQTIEGIVRDRIEPRVFIDCKHLKYEDGHIFIIRIPKSWNSPHMIKDASRFYTRNSNGKEIFDYIGLRSAFLASESLRKEIKNFRADRVGQIIADEGSIPIKNHPGIVVHVMPVSAFSTGFLIDIANIDPQNRPIPIGVSSWDRRYNFDGVVTFVSNENSVSYAQLFRNGVIEAFESIDSRQYPKLIHDVSVNIIKEIKGYLSLLYKLEVELPILIGISLVNVRGKRFKNDGWSTGEIDRNIIVTPEVILENQHKSIEEVLKPVFDTLWQASGYTRSPNYDHNGSFIGR
ncbi:helix-turn-helix domain-containing protein [Synechococcus sp. PCC 6312]|uniref:AlbA family DNA-binding domain-containing protein n=1 Tax=Synechococcus sp. (strain ATCC 27167 / PCC 6312) TaxID=195253 RepID=UPI00029F2498|nr:ATP-binding protein [Synechococcus sp. PCC 6312]AFY61834.1 putative transcriptional regulator with HTH domain [Synechococcus sp. PCC 6312]